MFNIPILEGDLMMTGPNIVRIRKFLSPSESQKLKDLLGLLRIMR